jgi:HSP20 family protein
MTEKKTTRSPPTSADKPSSNLPVMSNTGLATIFNDFFRPFDEMFQPLLGGSTFPMAELRNAQEPILDLQDRGDHFSVTAELPGFTKDDVDVEVDSAGIKLRAEKTEKHGKEGKGTYQTSTRSYYHYISLPEQVVSEKIDGTMKNGILQLRLPKRDSKLKDSARRVDLK